MLRLIDLTDQLAFANYYNGLKQHVLIRSEYESKFEIKFLAVISDVMQLILLVYFPGLMEQLHVY